jgi:hypothetical protein
MTARPIGWWFLGSLTLVGACSSDGGGDDEVDALPAPVDAVASADAPVAARGLVGTWRRYVEGTTDVEDEFTFGEDGRFAFDELLDPEGDHVAGTYTATPEMLVAEGVNAPTGEHVRLTTTYYVNATAFAPDALLPLGAHDGVVGTWTGRMLAEVLDGGGNPTEVFGGSATYQLRADGTATITEVPEGEPETTKQATYEATGADLYEVSYQPSADLTISVSLHFLDGAALVGTLYRGP